MQKDERLRLLAENIVKNSITLKKGEKVYIEAFSASTKGLLEELIVAVTKAGGVPFYFFNDNYFVKSLLDNATPKQMEEFGKLHAELMGKMDAYIGLRGYDDVFALADVAEKQMRLYRQYFMNPVHHAIRVPKTKWCVLRYPNDTMAAMSRMSTKAFEDFYFDACLLDYSKMKKAMEPLAKLMKKTDKVWIKAPGTDVRFSIKGIGAKSCFGDRNIPDGEVFSAPVKDSINGVVQFNTDTTYQGEFFSNIRLEFKSGKIVKGSSMANDAKFQKILDSDAGARFMGEFALGVNPYVTHPILDILFDEKIAGSFHMAIGNSYDDMDIGNK